MIQRGSFDSLHPPIALLFLLHRVYPRCIDIFEIPRGRLAAESSIDFQNQRAMTISCPKPRAAFACKMPPVFEISRSLG